MRVQVCAGQRQLVGARSLLSLQGFRGPSSGCQAGGMGLYFLRHLLAHLCLRQGFALQNKGGGVVFLPNWQSQAGLELNILRTLLPKCWDYKCAGSLSFLKNENNKV